MEQQKDEVEIDLMEIFYVLRNKAAVLILTAVVFAISTGLFTHYMITPMYASSSSIYVLTNESVISYADLQIGSSLTSDYIQMLKSPTVINTVIKNLDMENVTCSQLSSCIEVSNPTDTRILNVTVTYDDPRMAKEIVDELARVSTERISEIMDTQKPNIFEQGEVDTHPVSPNTKKNSVIAGLFGLLIAAVIVVIVHIMDDTIHSADDIEKYLKLNTLAAIPISEGSESEIKYDDRKRRKGESLITRIMRHRREKQHKKSKRSKGDK